MDDPITHWVHGLRAGDEEAARKLWGRYFESLVSLARLKLGPLPRRAVDEEDVALSVFRCLCDSAEKGGLNEIEDREGLWRLLVTMTINKAIDQKRRELGKKRGGGKVRGESVFGDPDDGRGQLDQLVDLAPPPIVLAMLEEQREGLFTCLNDPVLQQVALWKLDGLTNQEIADHLSLTTRSVERKLNRIREKWRAALQVEGAD